MMRKIIFISGPCAGGKTTFANALARHLVRQAGRPLYLIHGDDFHRGFIEPENKPGFFMDGQASDRTRWEDTLRFNWDCILHTADRALERGLDVIIEYVLEEELPRLRALAEKWSADLYYIVLTADEDELKGRVLARGDTDMAERALFLKRKLDSLPENRGHLYDNTGKTPEDALREIDLERYKI